MMQNYLIRQPTTKEARDPMIDPNLEQATLNDNGIPANLVETESAESQLNI
jgi:hypothetical protein